MKRILAITWILTILTMCCLFTSTVFAENETIEEEQIQQKSENVQKNETQGNVKKIIEKNKKTLEEYKKQP